MALKLRSVIRVIIICLLSLTAVLFLYLLVNNFQFERGTTFYIHFDHIGSLMQGAWIRKAGVKIGSITDIEINKADQRTVIVTFNLFPGQKLHIDSSFAIMSASMIGDQYVEVLPGSENSPYAAEGHVFKGESTSNVDTLLLKSGQVINDFTVAVTVLSNILKDKQNDIKSIIDNVNEASGTLNRIIKNAEHSLLTLPKSINDFSRAVDTISAYVEQINRSDTVFSLLKDNKVSQDLKNLIDNLNKISVNLLKVSQDMKEIVGEIIPPSEKQ
jgi:phospholipid/cholesterol/gamma-HCH transport system substrate-binding protein